LQVKQKMTRRKAFKEADVVIVAGCPLDFRLDYGRTINGRAKLIMVNRDSTDLTKNSWIRPAAVQVYGDPCTFLLQLAQAVGNVSSNWVEWQADLNSTEQTNEQGVDSKKSEKKSYPICIEANLTVKDTATQLLFAKRLKKQRMTMLFL
jgi:thiamine pyrophosphate-dependent acetolactate synthase large subunit-like protein